MSPPEATPEADLTEPVVTWVWASARAPGTVVTGCRVFWLVVPEATYEPMKMLGVALLMPVLIAVYLGLLLVIVSVHLNLVLHSMSLVDTV